ncbi:MAG: hypothetical protein ACYTHJ_04580 [Planctomycetota bacterium]
MNPELQRCVACGGESLEPGQLTARFWAPTVFTADDAPWLIRKIMSDGAKVRAYVCRDCGHVQLRANVEDINEILAGRQTRCRHCRYILRGISEPRCPECGKSI